LAKRGAEALSIERQPGREDEQKKRGHFRQSTGAWNLMSMDYFVIAKIEYIRGKSEHRSRAMGREGGVSDAQEIVEIFSRIL